MRKNEETAHRFGLMTVREAAKYLNIKEKRVRHEIFKKRIPYCKLGRSVFLDMKSLDHWVESLQSSEVSNG